MDSVRPWVSLRGRVALAFVAVALAAVAALAVVMLLATQSETRRLSAGDRARSATEVANEAAAAYRSAGSWSGADLNAAFALASENDSGLVIRAADGQIVGGGAARAGRGPPAGRGSRATVVTEPVVAAGQGVGTVELHFRGSLTHAQSVLRDKLGRAVLLGSLIAVAIALLGAALVSQRITLPLRRLAAAARRLRAGDLDARVAGHSDPGELGELARTFDSMADTLASQAEARRRLAGDLAHEVRTPIAILQGNLEELVDDAGQATPERLASLHEEVLRLGSLVEQLDVLGQADAPVHVIDTARVDVGELVRAQLEALRPQLDAKRLAVDQRLEAVTVRGDRVRLGQVVANLLSNALKFTPEDGRIEVVVESAGNEARISVADSGPGIPLDERERVFDRFWRGAAASAVSGRGIGLAVVADNVGAHRGRVELESSDTGGAKFVVTLPLN